MSDPGGCKLMNCTDLKDGKCHYPGDTCKYRQDEDLEGKLAAARCVIKDYREEIAKLEAELAKVRAEYQQHVAMVASKERSAYDEQQQVIMELRDENECLWQERDALRKFVEELIERLF